MYLIGLECHEHFVVQPLHFFRTVRNYCRGLFHIKLIQQLITAKAVKHYPTHVPSLIIGIIFMGIICRQEKEASVGDFNGYIIKFKRSAAFGREKYLMPAITVGTGDMFLKFCSAYSRKIHRQVFYLSDIRIKILIYLSRHTAHSFMIRITQYAGKVNMIVIF